MRENNWIAVNIALGKDKAEGTINIAQSSVYSSFLEPLSVAEVFAGDAIKTTEHEQVTIRTLDSEYSRYVRGDENAFLKIDTQGFEKQVLLGATDSLYTIKGIQVELSLAALRWRSSADRYYRIP